MKPFTYSRWIAASISLLLIANPLRTGAEDIDIFVGGTTNNNTGNPNVLIVLDNTSNWARQNQKWPGGEQQGQSEVDAIKTVLGSLDANINVGLMKFVTAGNANNDGGYVRYAIRPMNTTNKQNFSSILTTIYNNINSPDEKRNSNTSYGNLLADAYNYYAGNNHSQAGAGTLDTLADSAAYESQYTKFKSPLTCETNCAKNFIIFIGNPNASGPADDSDTNTTALVAAGGSSTQLGLPNFSSTTTQTTANLGNTSQCYTSQSACTTALGTSSNTDRQAMNCDAFDGGCTCGSSVANSSIPCTTNTFAYTVSGNNLNKGRTTACYLSTNSNLPETGNGNNKYPHSSESAICPSGITASFTDRQIGSCGKQGKEQTYTWAVSCPTNLGSSNACYASPTACSSAFACPSTYSNCTCSNPVTTVTSCASGGNRFTVSGVDTFTTNTPTGTYTIDKNPFNADEWTRHLYVNGVPLVGCNRQTIATYTIDVYNAQPNAQHTSLMLSMAKVGGGKYFAAKNKDMLVESLNQIFREIQSVNSTFASASLPINATNRAQNENQVFVGTFRPDPETKPRWFGNVKQYKLIKQGNDIVLGDKDGQSAINYTTGFVTECASSFWTSDTGNYWENYSISPSFAEGRCNTSSQFSDLPDGPRVEKGAVAQMLRRGNTAGTATWSINRTLYTASGNTLQTFNATNTGLDTTLVDWVRGADTEDEDGDTSLTETRASIHGDVVHSRPLPVNYNLTGAANVVLYYGSNDGTLRAVDAATGQEKWAFVAPEFNSKLNRLRVQSPLVAYPNMVTPTPTPTPTSRDYFFDGSIGLYQNKDNSKVWIFPTMRRGGRMVYALDVTASGSSGSPSTGTPLSIKWKFGCTPEGVCSSGASNIGQTWSMPNVAKLRDKTSDTEIVEKLAVVMGGGYDTCEDADTATPSCGTPKGNHVYVLDADNGSVIKTFNTLRSVIADVSMIDMNADGFPDYAYVGDTGGNLYRIAFSSYNRTNNTYSALASTDWSITRIGYTSGAGRKFQYAPAVYGVSGSVFVALGSGDRERPLATNYPFTTPVLNRFYVYRDCIPSGGITSNIEGGDNLDGSSMNATSAVSPPACDASKTSVSCDSTNKGWYVNLNRTGEQTVTTALIVSGLVTFSTNRAIPPAANTCSSQLGEARGYWLNLTSGSGAVGVEGLCGGQSSAVFVGGGLPPSPVFGRVPIEGKLTSVIIGAAQRSGNASVSIDAQKIAPIIPSARRRVYLQIKGTP